MQRLLNKTAGHEPGRPQGRSVVSHTPPGTVSPLHKLHHSLGNRAIQRLLKAGAIQASLRVGAPNDKYEQEADRVADQVMRMTEPALRQQPEEQEEEPELQTKTLAGASISAIQRGCPGCDEELQAETDEEAEDKIQAKAVIQSQGGSAQTSEEEEELVQAKERTGGTATLDQATSAQIESLKGQGQTLPARERAFFEPRFGCDFSGVRIHTDQRAQQSAASINAKAFTMGQDIVFASSQYSPASPQGKRLLAHELTHVIQQGGKTLGGAKLQRQADISLAPPGLPCALVTGSAAMDGSHVLFPISAARLNPNHVAQTREFVNRWNADGAQDDIQVDGYASVDGTQRYNWGLSCRRSQAIRAELIAQGVPRSKISIVAHGETNEFSATDLIRNRRVIISRHPPVAPANPLAAPPLRATVAVGPDPGNCGHVNFVINWSIPRNAAANGGFVIQNILFTWGTNDCNGVAVPNPDPRTSPLRYFEAWRVDPNTTNFTVDGSSDTLFWPGARPWAGNDTSGNVRIIATARYHDNVATLPAHMTSNNPNTFAGGLRSSLTNPRVAGNVSQAVEHRLMFRWECCPAGTISATIVDAHTP